MTTERIKRKHGFTVRMNDQELEQLKRLSNGKPFAQMCRELLLSQIEKVEVVNRVQVSLHPKVLVELNRISSNLNQAVKVLNSTRDNLDISALLSVYELTEDMRELINVIKATKK